MNLYESINDYSKITPLVTEDGYVIEVMNIKEDFPNFTCDYHDGIVKGMTFGLRMLNVHNVNVYGKVVDTDYSKGVIKVQHPDHNSIYEVPLNNLKINNRELRFFPKESDYSWFGFLDLDRAYNQESDFNVDVS